MKIDIANRTKTIFDAINDPRQGIQRMRVSELLAAVPGVGTRRTFLLMEKLKISEGRRIGGLGPNQIAALREEFILNKLEQGVGSLIVMSGPGGVGKSTITNHLRDNPSIWVSVSATTRQPRENEREGIDYFFLTDEKFDQMIAADKFLEWAEFAGNRYGTPREPVEHARNLGKNVLLEIEIAGARQVRSKSPESVLVFISPPSWEELVNRLENRGTDSPERRAARLALAEEEMAAAGDFDHILVNHSVEGVAEQLLSLASAKRH
jgi:guanylate kinase